MLKRLLGLATALAMAVMLTACPGTITTKPVSAEDYVRSAQAQVGAIYQTIGDLKAQGQITQAQSKSAIVKTEALELQVDTAVNLLPTNPGGAQANAQTAIAGLLAIKAALPAPKGK